jgi:hypothetical protein
VSGQEKVRTRGRETEDMDIDDGSVNRRNGGYIFGLKKTKETEKKDIPPLCSYVRKVVLSQRALLSFAQLRGIDL